MRQRIVAHVVTVDEHGAGRWIEQADEQLQQRRFAGTDAAHDRDRLTGVNGQRYVVERGLALGVVREAQVLELDGAVNLRGRLAGGHVIDFRREIEDLEQSVGCDRRALEQIDDEAGDTERLHHHVHVHEERGERADCDLARQNQAAAVAENDDRADRGKRRHPRCHQRVDLRLPVERLGVTLIRHREATNLVLFLHHRLNGSDAGEVLLYVRAEIGHTVLNVARRNAHLARHIPRIEEHERQRWQDQRGEHRRQVQHEAEADDGCEHEHHQQDAAHGDEALHETDVGDGARHHVADGELREELRALALQLGIQLSAQIECDVQARHGERECAPG